MKKQLKWRLGKLPTPDEVLKLLNEKLITKEEAREILFKEESEVERDKESLQSEIKFLRNLVEQFSTTKSNIVEEIKYIERPYVTFDWYKPYRVYCNSLTSGDNYAHGEGITSSSINSYSTSASALNNSGSGYIEPLGFSEIKTF